MRLRRDSTGLRHATGPAEFGRVAVLSGGSAGDRASSLRSGAVVLDALQRRGVAAEGFDPGERALEELTSRGFERAWIALQGPAGGGGALQGALEFLGVPYTGSGIVGSAATADRLVTKRLAQAIAVPTADFVLLREPIDLTDALERLGLPLAVKPAARGAAVHPIRIERAEQLRVAWESAVRSAATVFAERWVAGEQYAVVILQEAALPSIRVDRGPAAQPMYRCPSGLSAQAEDHLARLALAAYEVCGAEGWGCVDFVLDQTGRPQLLGIDTTPALGDGSAASCAAQAAGIELDELVWRVLETSFARTPVRPDVGRQEVTC